MDLDSASSQGKTLYFGYGSNLWKAQMLKRCPESTYEGLARLNGYRWIINDRGYANVVQTSKNGTEDQVRADGDVVWGLVYSLTDQDEKNLDINEGVPFAYTKEDLTVDCWPASSGSGKPNTGDRPEKVEMLVYIDRSRTEPDQPKREYVYRMNMGIADAVEEGMPASYVEDVMRKFIPEDEGEGGDGEVEELARRQAERFEDED